MTIPPMAPGADAFEEPREALEGALYEIKRVIVGQDAMLERLSSRCSPAATCCSRASPASPRR